MNKFTATFGSITLRVQAREIKGRAETLPLSAQDRTDVARGEAAIYEIHFTASSKASPDLSIEFFEPFVVVTIDSDEEEMMEEIALLIEGLLLTKIEHHFELERRSSSTPPWANQKE